MLPQHLMMTTDCALPGSYKGSQDGKCRCRNCRLYPSSCLKLHSSVNCENQGNATGNPSRPCLCPANFAGRCCEYVLCQGPGSFYDEKANRCHCAEGLTGEFCENKKSLRALEAFKKRTRRCHAFNTAAYLSDTGTCVCKIFSRGERCEYKCVHGHYFGDGRCQCVAGWSGDSCDIPNDSGIFVDETRCGILRTGQYCDKPNHNFVFAVPFALALVLALVWYVKRRAKQLNQNQVQTNYPRHRSSIRRRNLNMPRPPPATRRVIGGAEYTTPTSTSNEEASSSQNEATANIHDSGDAPPSYSDTVAAGADKPPDYETLLLRSV